MTVVWKNATMPPSASFQYGPHQKLFFHLKLKEIKNYKKAKMKGGLTWKTKYRELTRSLFNGNHFLVIIIIIIIIIIIVILIIVLSFYGKCALLNFWRENLLSWLRGRESHGVPM